MKNALLLAFFLPLLASAQDTCHLKKETDPFTHETKLSTGFVSFTSGGIQLSVSVDATPKDIDFFLWVRNEGKCFDENATVQINYDGDRLKANFRNSGTMNCDGAFHFTFRNLQDTPSNLEKLTSRLVKSLHIVGSNNTITDITLTDEQKQQFRRMAACIVHEGKSIR